MTVHDSVNVGPRPVNGAVNKALEIQVATVALDVAIEVQFENVTRGDEFGSQGARDKESGGFAGMPGADMAETIQHSMPCKNMVRRDEIIH